MAKMNILSREVAVYTHNEKNYICQTDMVRYKDPK